MISFRVPLVFLFVFFALISFASTEVLSAEGQGPGFPDGPGKDLLMSKCFQCHNEGMWKVQRQDRRAWEGVLYRMVGRGAIWSESEINDMANYLAAAFGPQENNARKP